ncbi:MAG: hypothetical protein NTX49_06185 [Chlamydiae bacterium]|nr:hypothetical protein [Chlamydiota bacterium]
MSTHSFILSPSQWLGEGKIVLNMVEEELSFFTRWNVSNKDTEGLIECVQEIQVKGLSDVMMNQFVFTNITPNSFTIELENQALGKIIGTGVIDDKVIGWEFRMPELGFEGFEFYEKQPDNSYLMHAEYSTSDQFRTLIKGKVWQPSQSQKSSQELNE